MIIQSILDTDLYKFTTSYAYMKLYPDAEGTFTFNDRDKTEYTKEFLAVLDITLRELGNLKLHDYEKSWCVNNIRFIPQCYWEWLTSFKFDANKINIMLDKDNHLHIDVTDKLYKVTLYEVPILAIVSQLRNRMLGYTPDEGMMKRLKEKIELSNQYQLKFSEFGTRRRFSQVVQTDVIRYISEHSLYCTGTSNVYYAMKFGMKPMGTHPHEWFMFHGAIFGYKQANYLALEDWVNVYDGDLGIALSDTYTTDVFLKNFSRKHAKLFDGVRHDSGDPFLFVNKVIKRYKELGIDPTTKTIIFSNALTFPDYQEIEAFCKGRIRCSAGIGTNLTNDCGHKPSNIVMKLSSCRMNANQPWYDCIKLSDDLGKHMGASAAVNNCYYELGIN